MLKSSKELPVEKSFANGLAEAVKNHGYYHCVIDGVVFSFFKNTHGEQDYARQTPEDYDYCASVASEMTSADCKGTKL